MTTVVALLAMVVGTPLVWRLSARWRTVEAPRFPDPTGVPTDPVDQAVWLAGWVGAWQGYVGQQAEMNRDRWRRAALLGWVFGVALLWSVTAGAEARDAQTCQTRTDSRSDIRALGVGMVDEVADYAEVTGPSRADLDRRATARALAELPPPDC